MNQKDVIVRVIGGLGNQMFQYAFIKALSLKRKCGFRLDKTSFDFYFRPFELEKFNIEKSYIIPFYNGWKLNKYFKRICYYIFRIQTHFMGYYKEERICDEFLMDFGNYRYFEGYFNSYKFFDKYKSYILEDFIPKKISKNNLNIITKYKSENTVSVHIRRGDYLCSNNSYFNLLWKTDYYDCAIKFMKNKTKNPIFLFFSDDLDWVKRNYIGNNYIYIDINKGVDNWQDMILMSKCKHNIIANSTFSWWGAYLNQNPDKIVICPKIYINNEFFNDNIYPDSRIKF